MTKHTKITVTEARFALESLTLSPLNPRQDVPEADVIELAESIWTAGLIQNLSGLADATGGAEIVAGGRRLRALQYLAVQHPDMAETRPELANPLVNLAPDRTTGEAWALSENIARRALHPAEEIRAYGKMEQGGSTPAIIARAFAVTEKHVYRRLALAHLPAPVLDALRADEISLSNAAAFTISDDEKRSLEVLEQVRGDGVSDHNIKRMLKPDAVRGTDRRAIFVGEDAYKAAGGRIGGDLFADESLFDDPETLDKVFGEKLDAAATLLTGKGWKWAEAITESYIGYHTIEDRKFERIYAEQGDLTEAETERYDELAELAEAEVLDEAGEAELAALQEKLDGMFSADQKAVSGVMVYVDRDGRLQGYEGLVAREDKQAAIEAGFLRKPARMDADDAEPKSPISQKLRDDLDRVVRGARQHAALRDPDMILALLAFQLTGKGGYRGSPFGIRTDDVPNWPTTEGAGYALDERLTTPANGPKDPWNIDLARSFRAFKGKGMEHVMAELHRHLAALLSAPSDLAPVIDKQVTTNIREVWTPTAENFFSRVGGPYLNDLWSDLLGLASVHPTITTFQKLKKGEKAEKLESLFGDDATRTALGLTDEQTARIAAWLPEGMA